MGRVTEQANCPSCTCLEKMDTEKRCPYVQIIYIIGEPKQGLATSWSSQGMSAESHAVDSTSRNPYVPSYGKRYGSSLITCVRALPVTLWGVQVELKRSWVRVLEKWTLTLLFTWVFCPGWPHWPTKLLKHRSMWSEARKWQQLLWHTPAVPNWSRIIALTRIPP